MDFTKDLTLPNEGVLATRRTIDGDKVPVSVTYPTEGGGQRTVRYHQTVDGDFVPDTGFTPDGDHNFPDEKWDW